MPTKTSVVVEKLYTDEVYAAVARAVRYEVLVRDDMEPYLRHLEETFTASEVREAVLDVCLVRWTEKPVTMHLRPELKPHCFGLLGPAPEQEDWFYTNNDGSPRPRPPRKRPDALVWKEQQRVGESAGNVRAKDSGKRQKKGKGKEVVRKDPPASPVREEPVFTNGRAVILPMTPKAEQPAAAAEAAMPPAPAATATPEAPNPLTGLSDERLLKRWKHARSALRFHGKDARSPAAQEVRASLAELAAEMDRRGMDHHRHRPPARRK